MELPRSPIELARCIDLALLKPDALRGDIERYCTVARELKLHGVCVHGSRVMLAASLLEDSDVKIISMAGFPLGANDSDIKRYETEAAIDNGAQEIEVATNIGWLKEGENARILREFRDVIEAADERPVGIIVECSFLNPDEKLRVAQIATEAGANSLVLGTGLLSDQPVSVQELEILRASVERKMGIKVGGKTADSKTAMALLKAGATRLAIAEPASLLASV